MSGNTSIAISGSRCIHSGGGIAHVLKHSHVPILIHHTVTLENNAPFKLPGGVSNGKLRVLFNTDPKQPTKLDFFLVLFSLIGHIGHFTNNQLVPNPFLLKTIPFFIHSRLGSRSRLDLLLANRSRNKCVKWKASRSNFSPMGVDDFAKLSSKVIIQIA